MSVLPTDKFPNKDMFENDLQTAWVSLLERYPWQWFCTFTFKEEIHPEAADKAFRYFVNNLNIEIHGKNYNRPSKTPVQWVRAMEWQKRGVIHYHALLANVGYADRAKWAEFWNNNFGFSRIDIFYDGGVMNYITKYTVKGGQIDVSDDVESIEHLPQVVEPLDLAATDSLVSQ